MTEEQFEALRKKTLREAGLPDTREMPEDFAPEFCEKTDVVKWRANEYGCKFDLGFRKTGDPLKDREAVENFREVVWQSLELARLGCWDEVNTGWDGTVGHEEEDE